ncbi:MAG: TlpA family protein disulfide reductase [Clostridium sp.]|nr:TlpA family protein disulfide reductase [Clostridium sp.]
MKKTILTFACAAMFCACNANSKQENAGTSSAPVEEQAAASSQEETGNAELAPDFTLNDINGKPLSLSSLRGKYVVLDFWGSWCIWCIKGMPEMKNYYEKYAGKFEILGVDCGDTDAKWKAAVKEHDLPWKHVYNPKSSDLLKKYGIQGFPTKIVIDPQGKIVKTVIGEDPAFYTYLDELFK